MKQTIVATLLTMALALCAVGTARAQALTCTQTPTNGGGFRLDCKPAKAPTPTRTPEPTPTATPTWEPTPTATATAAPPTATATPAPVSTNTPEPTPIAVTGARINVPLVPVVAPAPDGPDEPLLNANRRAILWLGDVSTHQNYADVRLVGSGSGLHIYAQMLHSEPAPGEAIAFEVNGRRLAAAFGGDSTWAISRRDDRGWNASAIIPWAELGGRPAEGNVWPLTVAYRGAAWHGFIHWGLPDYTGTRAPAMFVRDAPVRADAMAGGGTDCGAPDWPQYFPAWGLRNWGTSPYLTVESQWDTADWPCWNKVALTFALPDLPADAQIVSATLTLQKFGQMGYGCGDCPDGTQVTGWWAFERLAPIDEAAVSWDTLPYPGENTTLTMVDHLPEPWDGKEVTDTFDLTEIFRRAHARGAATATVVFYTAAGQYHSGKYFWSKEGRVGPVAQVGYVRNAGTGPTPPPSPTPTATSTPLPPPTPTPTVPPTPRPTATATPAPTGGRTYYVSPTGNDAQAGTTEATAWATFNRAWLALYPGDTLILMDGVYNQQMRPNMRNGEPGRPITIKAQHDGKAIIDGQGQNAVQLGDTWPGPVGGDWYVVEGIVARNGGETVWSIRGENTILRRISGYNADPDGNSAIIWPYYSKNILIEDCIAAGTGRKTIIVFSSEDVTIRRCYSDWARWDGLTFCGVPWPGGNGIHIYNGHRIRVENSISVGPVPDRSIAITNQSDTATVTGVEVLGSIAVGAGRTADGQPYPYPFPGPGICGNDAVYEFYPGENAGFVVYGQGPIVAPVFRDIFATNNANEGFGIIRPYGTGGQDVILDHATLYGNGMNLRPDGELTVTNSKIEGTSYQGEGARLTNRYVDGVLTDVPLWPWPMEARAQAELGLSITDWAAQYVGK